MARFKITIEYKGTDYCGWQIQKNAKTIQEVLENALFLLTNEKVKLVGSGRTDSGVHAYGQVAHFDSETKIDAYKIPFALNAKLPDDIKVIDCEKVDDEFHARFSPKAKTYIYKLYYSKYPSPLKREYYARLYEMPNIKSMKMAGEFLIGEHDFGCFQSSGSSVKDTVRIIKELNINQIGDEILITVTGNGFLYNMVRIIVGTLLDVGYGKKTITDIRHMILNNDRTLAGKTMPACGLYLLKVDY